MAAVAAIVNRLLTSMMWVVEIRGIKGVGDLKGDVATAGIPTRTPS